MNCPKCGNHLPEGARFCNNCGTNTSQSTSDAQNAKNSSSQGQYKVEYRAPIRRLAAKIVATTVIGGMTAALLWTPIIQPVLLSKTIGPEDKTGYHAELKPDKSAVNSADFPNGKWVRADGKAVLYIAHPKDGEHFEFEVYANKEKSSEECQLTAEAQVDTGFEANQEVKAVATYEGDEEEPQPGTLYFTARADEESIELISGSGWRDNHENQALLDGRYYRSAKVWIWANVEDGKWSWKFTPNSKKETAKTKAERKEEQQEPPQQVAPENKKDGGIQVNPPSIPSDGPPPVRVKGGGSYMSAEWMKKLVESGFYLKFEGVYYTVRSEVTDDNKFLNYYFNLATNPDFKILDGRDELIVSKARRESLKKMEQSCYGKTIWDFSSNTKFMPDFMCAQLQDTGRYSTPVNLPNFKDAEVGYEWRGTSFQADGKNNTYKVSWDPKRPYVMNLVGQIKAEEPKSAAQDGIVEKVDYDLNFYFNKNGTVDGEGSFIVSCLGSEKVTFWMQMTAVEFQPDFDFVEDYDFKSAHYVYEFETLDQDVPQFSEERETDYLAHGEKYEYKKYEYEEHHQEVE